MNIRYQSKIFSYLQIHRLRSLLLEESNIPTALLYAFMVSMLLLLIFSPKFPFTYSVHSPEPVFDPYLVESDSLVPEGFVQKKKTIYVTPSPAALKSAALAVQNKKVQEKKSEPVQKNIFQPYSTPGGRDEVRTHVLTALADMMIEYKMSLGAQPLLYKDKSGTKLDAVGSETVYVYDNVQNKESALAFTLGSKTNGFLFAESPDCRNGSAQNTIVFNYSQSLLTLCKEGGGSYQIWSGS